MSLYSAVSSSEGNDLWVELGSIDTEPKQPAENGGDEHQDEGSPMHEQVSQHILREKQKGTYMQ